MNKTVYVALGAVLAFIIAVKLHVPIKFVLLLLVPVLLYVYFPELQSRFKNDVTPFVKTHGVNSLHEAPPTVKALLVGLGAFLVFMLGAKLHIPIKLLIAFLVAGVLYAYFPELYGYYKKRTPQPERQMVTVGDDSHSALTNAFYIALVLIPAFILAFELHIKYLMYPLAAAIFYLYVPLLYLNGKKSALQDAQQDGAARYYSYLWFSLWFIVTCFFSYMLSHLLADVISSFHWRFFRYLLYIFLLLMAGGLGVIFYLQWTSKKIAALGDIHTNFETQGRLASFEILLSLLIIFLLKH